MFKQDKKEEEAPFAVTVSKTTYTEYTKGKVSVEKKEFPHREFITIKVKDSYGSVDVDMDDLQDLKELLSEVE